jgi:hypothetical protein|tara:strand:- start:3153 stop:3452 length:300 start_codon:yes stop_codon:yes gene_type:complete
MNVSTEKLQQAASVADALSSAGNRDINEILEAVSRLHRTEKQNLGNLVFALIGEWSRDYESSNYDARNEATCKMAFRLIHSLPVDLTEHKRADLWMPNI